MNKISFIIFNIYDWILNRLEKIGGKKYVFIFLFVGAYSFCGLDIRQVLASEQLDQQYLGSGSYNNTPVFWQMTHFTPSVSNISALSFQSANLWHNQQYEVYICLGQILNGTNYGPNPCGNNVYVGKATGTSLITNESTHKINFNPPLNLLPQARHYFVIHTIPNAFTIAGGLGGNATNTATSTWVTTSNIIGTLVNTFGVAPWFKTFYDNTLPPNINNLEVKLLQPAGNVGLSSPVFRGLFRDDFKYADTLVISIQNQSTGSSSVSFIPLANSTSTIKIKSFGPFPDDDVAFFNSYSQRGTSTWTAYLEKNGNIVSIIPQVYTFYVGETEFLLDGEISTAQACPRDDLNSFTGQFSCAMKKAFYWTVYPSQSSMDSFKTAGQNLKNSFPFTVYFQLTDTISNTISSTTLNQNGSIGIPMINKQKQIYIAPFISSTTMPNAIGQDNTNLIRNTISFIIWILVATAVFFTLRKL